MNENKTEPPFIGALPSLTLDESPSLTGGAGALEPRRLASDSDAMQTRMIETGDIETRSAGAMAERPDPPQPPPPPPEPPPIDK